MRALSTAALVALLASSGCAAVLREETTPFPTGTPRVAPWQMNRELLAPTTKRIRFVVELVRGGPPEAEALDHLARTAAHYGDRPAAWIGAHWPGAPRVTWLDGDRARALDPLDDDTSWIFVRYLGGGDGFGRSGSTYVDGKRRPIYFIEVYQENHRALQFGWLTEARLEMQTLVHEYGHLLGLPSPSHGFFPAFPSWKGGAHCVNPDCPLVLPRLRALLYGLYRTGLTFRFLDDYCAECRADIARAQQYWRSRG
jgi:hypothetical protein